VLGPDGLRAHVTRRINEDEAAVVRRIFKLCADGRGLTAIAKLLNDEHAVSPRSQQARPCAWAASSVRDVLHRDLYRGEIVWNRSRKRDQWGGKKQRARAVGEWLRVPAPDLRIVSDALWAAAHERISRIRASYLRGTDGRLWGRPTRGTDSKYLLCGLARCGICNGSLYVKTRKATGKDRAYFYGCTSFHLRGSSVCSNGLELPMEVADRAVLDAFERDILRPDVVEAAVTRAMNRLLPSATAAKAASMRLQAELQGLEAELSRLTAAIAGGGQLGTLVQAIQERGQRRIAIRAELDGLNRPALDPARLRADLRARLDDWRGLLTRHIPQARQIIRKLLTSAILFTPTSKGRPRRYEFRLEASLAKLIGTNTVASPRGHEKGMKSQFLPATFVVGIAA
jgi:hypothetical protein